MTIKKQKAQWLIRGFVCVLILAGCGQRQAPHNDQPSNTAAVAQKDDLSLIARAYKNKESHFFVESAGIIENVLNDDLKIPRHQRFIVRLRNGQTLLIAHNIDVAPRINDLKIGERIYFRGEYEWNDKGGVIHYTHHDPTGRVAGGWIEYKGKVYQ